MARHSVLLPDQEGPHSTTTRASPWSCGSIYGLSSHCPPLPSTALHCPPLPSYVQIDITLGGPFGALQHCSLCERVNAPKDFLQLSEPLMNSKAIEQ